MKRNVVAVTLLLAASVTTAQDAYDLVISNGRVIDPETGLDAVRHVGIAGGVIAAVSDQPLHGRNEIDASHRVVAPGFIDRNTYTLGPGLFRARAADGVTTVLNLEQGAHDVDAAYRSVAGSALVNYGFAADHTGARLVVTHDPEAAVTGGTIEAYPSAPARDRALTEAESTELLRHLRRGLEDGAIAIGMGPEYLPGATNSEIFAVFSLAAEHAVPVQIHVREWNPVTDHQEIYEPIAAAAITGGRVHLSHMNSVANKYIDRYLRFVDASSGNGIAITTECYPYTAGMAGITSSLFDGWENWPEERFARFRLPGGEILNRQTFAARHAEGGMVILEIAKPEWVDACVAHPATQIASDGSWEQGETHPRVAGTHSRVLGHYVRERRLLTLESAIRKMTLLPALALQGAAPQLARKGRLQQGMDADLTVFDPEAIADRATYEQPTLPPQGIDIVIVNGVIVVRNGEVVDGVTPGAAIRRTRGTPGPRPDATQP